MSARRRNRDTISFLSDYGTDDEYGDFAECQVVQSARQRVEAGEWTFANAQQRARAEQADLLAAQLVGQGHTLLRGVQTPGGALVGG